MGYAIEIKEVVNIILEIVGYKSRVVFDKTKPEGPFSRALDISLAKRLLDWEPKIDIREGLERTIEWMRHEVPLKAENSAKARQNYWNEVWRHDKLGTLT